MQHYIGGNITALSGYKKEPEHALTIAKSKYLQGA